MEFTGDEVGGGEEFDENLFFLVKDLLPPQSEFNSSIFSSSTSSEGCK